MRQWVGALLLLLFFTSVVSALEYEDKPDIAVSFVGSNYLDKGDEKTIILAVYNNAEREKVKYDDMGEAAFFSGREDMLFTAYNVVFELEGNEYVEIKTPPQRVPALIPFKPITLQFIVKVSENAKAGDYELYLKVTFDRIIDLKKVESYTNPLNPLEPISIPEQVQYTIVNGQETGNGTKIYRYKQLLKEYELDYVEVTKTIPITVSIEKEDVKLEVVSIKSENLIAKGKGKIEVEVKNVGEKTGKNAYLLLTTPSGIEASALSISQKSSLPTMSSMSGMPTMFMIPSLMQQTTSATPTTGLKQAQAAYYVGDLKPGETVNATFYLKLDVKDEGNYPLQLKAVYLNEYGVMTESESVSIGIFVGPAPKFEVLNVESKVLVNAKGDLIVELVSDTDLEDVSICLNTQPPISVLSSEYFAGNVKSGEKFSAIFKIKASSEAEPLTYPAEITVKYKSMDEYVSSDPIKIGIEVKPKIKFEVYDTPKIAAGEEKIVTFTLKNTGEFEIREATARLTIVDPFSSSDDTAYIGDLKPGETADISFKISVDRDATPKLYGLNLEVKYKGPEGEWAISEPIKATIEVIPAKPPYNLIGLIVLVVILAVAVYIKFRR